MFNCNSKIFFQNSGWICSVFTVWLRSLGLRGRQRLERRSTSADLPGQSLPQKNKNSGSGWGNFCRRPGNGWSDTGEISPNFERSLNWKQLKTFNQVRWVPNLEDLWIESFLKNIQPFLTLVYLIDWSFTFIIANNLHGNITINLQNKVFKLFDK